MKTKFRLEIVLLGIVSIISLVSVLGVHSFEASAAVNTINGDASSAQNIVRQAGNITVTNSTGTVKIGIGPNVIVINKNQTYATGVKQSFVPTSSLAAINIGTLSADPTSLTKGDVWVNGTLLKYSDNSGTTRSLVNTVTTQTILNKRIQDTTNFLVNTLDSTKKLGFDVSQITTGHTDTWKFPNANSTFMGTTITNDLGQIGKLIFGSNNLIIRNPASTFTTTLAGGAVTANQTLNMPAIAATDTIATLGLGQTFTGPITMNSLILGGQMSLAGNTLASSGHVYTFPSNTGTVAMTNGTFTGTLSSGTMSGTISGTPTFSGTVTFTPAPTLSAGLNTGGNITSTAASGKTFKISAPSGVAICIGTGC